MTAVLSTITFAQVLEYDANRGSDSEVIGRGDQVVYILEFEGGLVKVGQTTDFVTRISAHCYDKRTRGRQLVEWWVQRSSHALEDERMLITLATELGGKRSGGREWFTGLDAWVLMVLAETKLLGGTATQ